MANQKRYLRGQIWHWNDPVYGEKKDGKWVDSYESIMRYSRYVIIMQDTDTINGTALIVPCSTQPGADDTEVEFSIYDGKASYARCKLITPVQTKQLDNYIGTLDDDTMQTITAMTAYLIGFGEKPEMQEEEKQIEELKSIMEKEEDPEKEDTERNKSWDRSKKWDKDKMKVYIEDFDNRGCQYASLMYNLTEKSARKYYSSFKLKLAEEDSISNKGKAILA